MRSPAFDEFELASLSAYGLSPAQIAVALAIRQDKQSLDEVAIAAKRMVSSINNYMNSRRLFARQRRTRKA